MANLLRILGLGTLIRTAISLPLQVTIPQRNSECLFDTLEAGEKVTLSVFILSGANLKATVTLDGPIVPTVVDSAAGLWAASESYAPGGEDSLSYSNTVDFEHLNEVPEDDDEEAAVPKEEEPPIDPNDPDATEKRRQRRERQREKFLAAKQKRDKRKLELQKKIRQDGDPFVYTEKAPQSGWYRMCVTANWQQVVAEMELRKESEMGGVDENGDVISYEQRTMNEEDKELEKDTASQEGIKDEDFEETREKVKELRRLLNEIQGMQQRQRRRLTVHAETNEHSHSRMVLSSLLETLFFMAVTGYQVYTIRKWFSGAPALGR